MATLAARSAARRSIFGVGRDANVVIIDSNAARLFEVDVDAGLGDAGVGAWVVAGEVVGTVAVRRGVEGDEDDGCCLPSGILMDTR